MHTAGLTGIVENQPATEYAPTAHPPQANPAGINEQLLKLFHNLVEGRAGSATPSWWRTGN